ncbi:unnamed protein product [Allacma fusca]|uniref:Uncharacterized protein n=1 Tax=Allacma fusca TaxID=39272 RepID=A0A8J2K0P6_9HEXA|nr:unnamed protein product [Allacma fusca]
MFRYVTVKPGATTFIVIARTGGNVIWFFLVELLPLISTFYFFFLPITIAIMLFSEFHQCFTSHKYFVVSISMQPYHDWTTKKKLKEAVRKCVHLRAAFEKYSDSCGVIWAMAVLLAVVHFGDRWYLLLSDMSAMLMKREILLRTLVEDSVQCFYFTFTLFVFAYVGQEFENKILETKQSLLGVTLDLKNKQSTDVSTLLKIEKINDLVFDWDWRLGSCNFFRINFSLLGRVTNAGLTYLIFIFQLHGAKS